MQGHSYECSSVILSSTPCLLSSLHLAIKRNSSSSLISPSQTYSELMFGMMLAQAISFSFSKEEAMDLASSLLEQGV